MGWTQQGYFNFGGQGPLSEQTWSAIAQGYDRIRSEGPFSQRVNSWLQEESAKTRQAIAEEVGTTPETITLTENVTVGCNIALWGLKWQQDDHILLTDCEHPGIIATVQELADRFGIKYSFCPIMETLNEGDPTAVIQDHWREKTKLVVLSHLLWNTGQVLPLQEITRACHEKGIFVLVDAAQSVGSLPLNLPETGVDFYAFTGHKWLCGPAGVGGLYISPQSFGELRPTFIGWRGINTDSQGKPVSYKEDGRKFEVATSAYPQYMGLTSAIAQHNQWGTPTERYQKICQLSAILWERLSSLSQLNCLRTSPPEAGLVSFQLDHISHQSFVTELEEAGFLLRTLADPDCIRACVHYFTTEEEIDALVTTIKEKL
ncbi:aminotransferase class V [Halothece sp. PCC 7418]|uniref:aminotransferase class V-fold PLP-dependent enzyme n=1 Tax=Halothece sp. (strain PCC 7418) TaxID=65093 RepID=UPI0002A07DE5|nr:aminotransferase class V-fold PLP-dependent enzyme [Halothece sp. PCC 7418]AFZ43205.1 aminotransferase class V [Halothece sp. PCC 7418]